jgi:hypothetical protein
MGLTDESDIPNWIGAAICGLACVTTFILSATGVDKKREFFSLHSSGFLFVAAVMDVVLSIDQGTTVRGDGVESAYGRWAFMVAVNLLFAYEVAAYLEAMKQTRYVIAGALGLSTVALMFGSLSTGGHIWFHYSLSCALYALFAICVFVYPLLRSSDGYTALNVPHKATIYTVRTITVCITLPYLLVAALGHSFGGIFELEVENWIYLVLDVCKAVMGILLVYYFKSLGLRSKNL